MEKNILKHICLLACCLMTMAFAACSSDDNGGKEIASGENTILSLKLQLALNHDKITQDYTATIDGTNITLCVPTMTDFKDLVVTYAVSGGTVTVNGVAQENSKTKNDFTNPVTYVVTAGNGAKKNYTVNICNTKLPVVYINTPDGKPITSKTEWKEHIKIKIVEPDGTVNITTETASIRGRGNTTWGYPKKPYAIKFAEKQEVLGMKKHKRWVLLANWMDRTLIRNHVTFEIARRTSLAWTPNGKFVEVVFNGSHAGNYYLCEQIRIDKNRVNINELKATDTASDAITGGYLMELDINFDEVNKFRSPLFDLPYQFKSPDEDVLNEQQKQYMYDYVSELERLLKDDTEFANSTYMKMIDVDSYIDFWLINELAGNGEPNHPKSCYAYKDKGKVLTAGPVWDFDYGTYRSTTSATFRSNKGMYYGRLFQDPKFVARVKERWATLKPKMETIPAYIDTESEKLKLSDQINIKMWPITKVVNLDESFTYEEAIQSMKDCYNKKLKYTDEHIKAM